MKFRLSFKYLPAFWDYFIRFDSGLHLVVDRLEMKKMSRDKNTILFLKPFK